MSFCSSWSARATATPARPDEPAWARRQSSLARCSWVVVGLLLLVAPLVSCGRETGRTPIRGTSASVGHRVPHQPAKPAPHLDEAAAPPSPGPTPVVAPRSVQGAVSEPPVTRPPHPGETRGGHVTRRRRPAGVPALRVSRVELAEGTAHFRRNAAIIDGADFCLGEAWWLDIDGDGRLEVLADVSFACERAEVCGNAWGSYLAAWRWRGQRGAREGVYELVATADDVKMVTWLRRDGVRLRVRGYVKTGPGRNDVDDVVVALRRVGDRLVVMWP